MAKKSKKKSAKKTASAETPPADEPEPVEDDVEPETPDPFVEDAEPEAPAEPEAADEDKSEEKAPVASPDPPTVTFTEKKAQERGEKPSTGDAKKPKIVAWLERVEYTADDIETVDYYGMAGVSVITMSDGKKFDVTD